MITIIVGDERSEYFAHKDRLCEKSQYFQTCLNDPKFIETSSSRVELSEDDPKTVERFIEWLYTGKYEVNKRKQYLKDYKFATVRLADAYANTIIDTVRAYDKEERFHQNLKLILDIYREGLGTTYLSEYARKSYVCAFMKDGKELALGKELQEAREYAREVPAVVDVFFDLMETMCQYRRVDWDYPDAWTGCVFHIHHREDSECQAADDEEKLYESSEHSA